jgi:hypothetical protein
MKPLQVYIDDADSERLEAWSRERGWTKSQAIRVAIHALTRPPAADPVLSLSGMIHDLPADCSEQFDRYINETFVAEPSRTYRRNMRRSRTSVRR